MIYEDYLVLTPGPVKMFQSTLDIGAQQTPYFRNDTFSKILLECEQMLCNIADAPIGSRVVFLTASGTAAMEATVQNLLCANDKALVVNGGGFGARFIDICNRQNIPNQELEPVDDLSEINTMDFPNDINTFIVNAHETSIGLLYNLDEISKFVSDKGLLNIVDAISMFITDKVSMIQHNIDALIVSSQKGLALPPGLSMVILSPRAISKLNRLENELYFNFRDYLDNGERGQTPYTPAVTIILQLHERLKKIVSDGIESNINHAAEVALYFREQIKELPLKLYTHFQPNAMTALSPTDNKSARDIVDILEQKYKIIVTPNGGELKDTIFRVSHMGNVYKEDMDTLVDALHDIYRKG